MSSRSMSNWYAASKESSASPPVIVKGLTLRASEGLTEISGAIIRAIFPVVGIVLEISISLFMSGLSIARVSKDKSPARL